MSHTPTEELGPDTPRRKAIAGVDDGTFSGAIRDHGA